MAKEVEELMLKNGWIVECDSPLEIYHRESHSRADGFAAKMIIEAVTSDAYKFAFGMMADLERLVAEFLDKNEKAVISRIFVPAAKAEEWLKEAVKEGTGAYTGLAGVVLHNGGHFHASIYGGDHYRLLIEYP